MSILSPFYSQLFNKISLQHFHSLFQHCWPYGHHRLSSSTNGYRSSPLATASEGKADEGSRQKRKFKAADDELGEADQDKRVSTTLGDDFDKDSFLMQDFCEAIVQH